MALGGTPVIGEYVNYYIALADGTNVAGEVGTADLGLAETSRRFLLTPVASIRIATTTVNSLHSVFFTFKVPMRFFSFVVYNATSQAFQASTSVHKCTAYPTPTVIQ